MPQINDDGPAPYVRSIEGKTETMIPIGPHEAVNETSAKALGLVSKETITTRRFTVQTDRGPRELVITRTIENPVTVTPIYRRHVGDPVIYRPLGRAVRSRPGKPTLRVIDRVTR